MTDPMLCFQQAYIASVRIVIAYFECNHSIMVNYGREGMGVGEGSESHNSIVL